MADFEIFDFKKEYKEAHISKINVSTDNMKRLCDWLKKPSNICLLIGGPGSGKTTTASAIKNYLVEVKGISSSYIRTYDEDFFFNELKYSMNLPAWGPDYRIKIICESPFFIYDDLGSTFVNDWHQEKLHMFIEKRLDDNLATIITTNLTKKDFKEKFHERTYSRLFSNKNLILNFNEEDMRCPE